MDDVPVAQKRPHPRIHVLGITRFKHTDGFVDLEGGVLRVAGAKHHMFDVVVVTHCKGGRGAGSERVCICTRMFMADTQHGSGTHTQHPQQQTP